MREHVEAERTGTVQLDLYVQIAYDILGSSARILLVTYASVHHDPVVEQLRRDCHVKYVIALFIRLIVEAEVKRDIQFLENVVQLVGHSLCHIRVQERSVVYDSGLLVRKETIGQQKGEELFLHLVFGTEGTFHA